MLTDTGNEVVTQVDLVDGKATDVAGIAQSSGNVDGVFGTNKFYAIKSSNFSPDGQYLAMGDFNNRIRKMKICGANE